MLQRIASIVPDDELIKIKINKSTYSNWAKEDEFELDGNMFDVVKKEEHGLFVFLYCLNDEKEARIIKNFKKQYDDAKNHNGNSPLKNNSQILNFTAILNNTYSLQKRNNIFGHIPIIVPLYNSIKPEIVSPPPKA